MTEAQHQSTLFQWSRAVRQKYPDLKLLYHIPNGGRRDAIEMIHLKQQGLRPGVPDLHLPVSRHGYHSLYIELKTPTGQTSPEQDWWLDELNKAGCLAIVCHGWEEAAKKLEEYLNGNMQTVQS